MNPKKAISEDSISPALINIAAETLSTPLSTGILNDFTYSALPNKRKLACFKSLDKETDNKNEASAYQSISILNTFSKIYEKFGKDLIVSNTDAIFFCFYQPTESRILSQKYLSGC